MLIWLASKLRRPEITSYDQIEPLRKLYDNLFNDRDLFAIEVDEKKAYSHLANKYGPRIVKLVEDLENDLDRECRILDYKLTYVSQRGLR